MNQTIVTYRMNPAEDEILFSDQLAEGMWVLAESPQSRSPYGDGEDERIRAQRFRLVTRLRREPAGNGSPARIIFVGEWVDGYQEVHRYGTSHGWLVKKPAAAGPSPESV